MFAAVALAVGLAMDATAVAAVRGMARRGRDALVLPLLFGAFQAGMAAIGWALGHWGGQYVETIDHWIAFGLLTLIGGKMFVEAVTGAEEKEAEKTGLGVDLLLAVATSIDAAAAGITLPLMPVSPWISLGLIGGVTYVCCLAGYVAGRRAGDRLGKPLEVIGGLVLVGLGVRILVQHL